MNESEYHWAYATILLTKADIELKMSYLTNAQKYLVQTFVTAGETVKARRDLATNPCVTLDSTMEIYSQMMTFAEQAQGYIRTT